MGAPRRAWPGGAYGPDAAAERGAAPGVQPPVLMHPVYARRTVITKTCRSSSDLGIPPLRRSEFPVAAASQVAESAASTRIGSMCTHDSAPVCRQAAESSSAAAAAARIAAPAP